jgi:threonine dehydrogenase-like Zn-dependent dehydrogenase
MTGGRGPDACIDAVGMEAHAFSPDAMIDKLKQAVKLETDRPHVLRTAIQACRTGGTVSVPGVYGGIVDTFPIGAFMQKGLTLKTGQTHVQRYLPKLLEEIVSGRIDPSFIVTHRAPIDRAPEMYETFAEHRDGCIKVVLDPAA